MNDCDCIAVGRVSQRRVPLVGVGKSFHGIMVSVLWCGMMGMVSITIIIIIITIADFHRLDPRRSVTDLAQVPT